jgi:sugar phosphate isomerase/epimerase
MHRRSFLKNSALSAAALSFANTSEIFAMKGKISVQLYSVRDDMAKDAAGTIAGLAKMGFKNVEGFGLDKGSIFGMPVADFKKILTKNGVLMPSCHTFLSKEMFDAAGKPAEGFTKLLDDASVLGVKYVIHPWIFPEMRTTETIKQIVGWMNSGGQLAQKRGISLAYHNHDFEFTTRADDGRLLYEVLLQELDSKVTKLQMDLYWVQKANYQPTDWLNLYPNRIKLFHVKDMAADEKHETIEVGDGIIDFQKIFNVGMKQGVEYYVIELEHYLTTPMQGIEKALKGLKKLKF